MFVLFLRATLASELTEPLRKIEINYFNQKMCCILAGLLYQTYQNWKQQKRVTITDMLWLTIIACTYQVSNMYIGMYILFVLLHCEPRKVCTEGSQKGMRMATYIYTQDWPAQIGCNLICNSSNVQLPYPCVLSVIQVGILLHIWFLELSLM